MREEDKDTEEDFEIIESEEEDKDTDTSPYDIISYGADFTLSVLYDKMNKEEIEVPKFQRRYVWNLKQASKLIESFLLGLPIPGVFLAKEKPTGNLLVIDGQQRLVTCKAFKDEKFTTTGEEFRLHNVHEKWEGKKYSELDPADRKRFDDSVLRATIIQQVRPEDDDTSVYHIFQRLNTGGTILQNQEIRNCVYHGNFNNFLLELNKNQIWRSLYNSKEPNKRMKDVELILRFFSFYYGFEEYTKPLNEFMSRFMAKQKNKKEEDLDTMKKLFIETISFINEKAGSFAFRPKGNINGAAFDSIMYVVSKFKSKIKPDLKGSISKLFEDIAYLKAIREGTTDPDTIVRRFSIAKRYLIEE